MFAERLNTLSQMYVKEAADGDRVMPGVALVAPGSMQMRVIRSGGIYLVKCEKGEKVSGHCPSVDVLMHSAASCAGANAVGVILTGMGSDGAAGLKAMHDTGARTIAQNQESCVVFGMPRVAINNGAVDYVLALEDIAERVLELFSK
jgi:two-component system chemotaxis response regulator CheB